MARRAELFGQREQAQQQYDQLEAALKTLDRQLCAMHGALAELDALLAWHAALDASARPANGEGEPIEGGQHDNTSKRSLYGSQHVHRS
jgi:peptidoglycan hydrolase CwlO-like protein